MLVITNNATEIIAGTSSRTNPAYFEAAKITGGDDLKRSAKYLRNFMKSINKVVGKQGGRDQNLVKTKGNIESLSQYKTVQEAISYLDKHLPGNEDLAAVKTILRSLTAHRSLYMDGYKAGEEMVMLEYEAAASIAIRTVSMLIASSIDVQVQADGSIKFKKESRPTGGLASKIVRDMAKEIQKDAHVGYLKALVDPKSKELIREASSENDKAVTESAIGAANETFELMLKAVDLVKKGVGSIWKLGSMIYRTAFGILPLIRSICYLHYNKKAQKINDLEIQAKFVELNIEQLKASSGMDEKKKAEIIKKQQAVVEAYRKKAEKIRAQYFEDEKSTAKMLKDDEGDLTKEDSSDDTTDSKEDDDFKA